MLLIQNGFECITISECHKVRFVQNYFTVKFDKDLGIKAGKKKEAGCVEVKWKRPESGVCYVKYEVKFKNEFGSFVYTKVGYNVNEMEKCKIPSNMAITKIQLTVSFRSVSKSFTVPVSEMPSNTAPAKSKG